VEVEGSMALKVIGSKIGVIGINTLAGIIEGNGMGMWRWSDTNVVF